MTEIISDDTFFQFEEEVDTKNFLETKCGEILLVKDEFIFVCSFCDERYFSFYEYFEHLKQNHIEDSNSIKENEDITEFEDEIDEKIKVEQIRLDEQLNEAECLNTSDLYEEIEYSELNDDDRFDTISEKSIDMFEIEEIVPEEFTIPNINSIPASPTNTENSKISTAASPTNTENSDATALKALPYRKNKKKAENKCELCGKCFKRVNELKTHLNVHYGVRPFKCTECEATFTHFSNLRTHRYLHLETKPFPCQECDKSFVTNSARRAHMRIHTGQLYECEICDQKLTRISGYKRHMMTHQGARDFLCVNCGKKFLDKKGLTKHMKCHFKNLRCVLCQAKFNERIDLREHMREHEKDEEFKCNICGEDFQNVTDIIYHMRTHRDNL